MDAGNGDDGPLIGMHGLHDMDDPRAWRRALMVVVATTVLRLALAASLPLVADEAYYWTWSRHLAPGYLDHPPGIALAIRLGTLLLGDTVIGVRLVPVLLGAVLSLAVAALARHLAGDRAALRAAIACAVVPLATGMALATPDAPMLACWACAMYAAVRAVDATRTGQRDLRWWIATGVASGAAGLSKYTAVFLPAGVLLAIITRRELRPQLRTPGPWIAGAIALVIVLPVFWWNMQHHWASFAFQLGHGLALRHGSPRFSARLATAARFESELAGGQLALVSPIFMLLALAATWRALRRATPAIARVVAVPTVITLAAFAVSALRGRVEPNWPAPAWVGAIALACAEATGAPRRRRLALATGVAAAMTAVALTVLLAPDSTGIPALLRARGVRQPLDQGRAWEPIANAARPALAGESGGRRTWLAAPRYQDAAMLEWTLASHVPHAARAADTPVFAIPVGERPTAQDYWPGFAERAHVGDRLVLLLPPRDDAPPPPVSLSGRCFARVSAGPLVVARDGARVVRERQLWLLEGWTGRWPTIARRDSGATSAEEWWAQGC